MRGTAAALIAAASINVAAAWQHIAAHRPRKLTRRNADLYGGQDTQRNEDIEALKRAFYGGGSEDTFRDAAASDARLVATANEFGLIKDVPLCRWSMHLLPHQQTILNVWQPQYTHMFEELVRGPEPWLYAHVQLPGGRDNIGNPEYDLKNETSLAPRTGTLMRVARYEKQPDNRWAVWVQGLARCRVEKALRNMPYARADIRIIPDGEAFSHFGGTSAFPECWSAALLEDEAFARVEFLPPPEAADVAPVCQFDVAAATAWDGDSMEGTYAAPLSVDADARNAADAADTTLLAERERDVWLKLDELLRRLSSVSPTAVPVLSQILGLLPPDGDWPEDFALTAVAERLAANVAPPDPFNRRYTTPPGGYPAHRRAARLSYAVWAVVGGQAQPVLDARTTAERLALALRRLEALCDGLAAEGG